MSNIETRKIPLSAAKLELQLAMNRKRPVFLWGPPGIGKSDLIQHIASEMENCKVIDLRMALLDPTDLRGIPFFNSNENTMSYAPPDELPSEEDARKFNHIILFLDELNSAPPATQASAYQLVLNRRIGRYELPDNVTIIAAGNRESDRGVTYKMPAPLANRFIHIELNPTFDDWQEWAIDNKIHPDVIGFLSHQGKSLLHKFEPRSAERAFPTPRSWAFVSDIIYGHDNDPAGLTKTHIRDLIAGTVGEAAGLEFNTFLDHANLLPKVEDILSGKVTKLSDKAKDSISAQYSLVISMSYELKLGLDQERREHADKNDGTNFKTSDAWCAQLNNFLSFMMYNFVQEVSVMGARTLLVNYQVQIVPSRLPIFEEFHKKFGSYVIGVMDYT